MQASQRLDRFGAEVFASLNNKLLALKAQGKTIYNMSVGTPDFKPYDHVVEALTQAAQDPEMWKYALRDLPELKQAVCDYYERRFGVSGITPSMVQSCNGTQEGVGHLGLALLDPGDTILVPDPCYPVFEAGAKIADAKLEYYPLVAEHNYLPYVAGIDPEVADRAKYMIVSLPANPVGSVGTPEVYEEIIAFAREHDLLIVHDNAYSDIVFDGEPGGSFLQYPGALEAGAKIADAKLEYYPLVAEHNYLPYVAGIDPEVADRAKYMIVSLPANPVGSVGTPEVYEEIIAFAREHDLLIVHDNAYSDIVFDGEPGGSFLQYPGALEVGVEFFSLSKSFNVTGARIGFLVGREDVVSAFAKLRGQIDFGMFFPIQKAAIACLNGPRDEVEAQRLKYQERRDALCDGLEGLGWERPNAHGSMFVWAKLPGGRTDSMAFCEELMEKAGVVVTPGASFGPSGEGHVRMALVLPPDQIALAVEAIREAGLY